MRRPDQTEILDGDAVTKEEEIENISLLDLDLEKSFVNYPNPFSNADGGTKFHVPLEKAATTVDLKIYTLLGQLVKSENRNVSNQPAPSSYTGITWDGRNDAGQTVLNGVYIGYIKINYEDGSSRVAQTKVMYIK
jgi:flagellar hook assembly protein FlgD